MVDAPESWAAFNVEKRHINELLPYANNSRIHSKTQVAQIASSIREWGFTNPVLIDPDGEIIAGHGRVMALRQLGIDTVPVIIARGWSEAKKKAYVIADNKLAENASWDEEVLGNELAALAEMDFNLDLVGFDESELDRLMGGDKETEGDPEDIPDAPVVPTSKPGDVWVLGKHRLVNGDSTNADDVAKCLNGVTPHLMVTDPPYGVEYDADWRNNAKRSDGKPIGASAVGKVSNDGNADWTEAWDLFPGEVAYVWCASLQNHTVAESLIASKFGLRSFIIWNKGHIAISRGDYHWQHEPCWYAVRKNGKGHWNGDRKQSTVWDIDKPKQSETGHSTQKPIECMARPMRNNSSPGQAIYEPFCGSGTTLIAAEMEGRVCHAIELEPKYCDVIIQRFQQTFGIQVVREADGTKYDDIDFEKPTTDEVVAKSSKDQASKPASSARKTRSSAKKTSVKKNSVKRARPATKKRAVGGKGSE